MEKEKIKARLKNCSMPCFVNCFEGAWKKDGDLTNGDILKYDSRLKPKATHPIDKDRGLETRCYGINEIFKGDGQIEALQICIGSNISAKLRAKAKGLHDDYSQKNR